MFIIEEWVHDHWYSVGVESSENKAAETMAWFEAKYPNAKFRYRVMA